MLGAVVNVVTGRLWRSGIAGWGRTPFHGRGTMAGQKKPFRVTAGSTCYGGIDMELTRRGDEANAQNRLPVEDGKNGSPGRAGIAALSETPAPPVSQRLLQ